MNEIAGFYAITKDRDLALKLGITATTLSNWKRRDTYDISVIVSRCQKIDINRLLRGWPLKSEPGGIEKTPVSENDHQAPAAIIQLIQEKDKVIIKLAEEVGRLKEQIKNTKESKE